MSLFPKEHGRPPQSPQSGTKSSTTREAVLTVTQATRMVKHAIEQHLPSTVRILGEISNFKKHSSGHLYFVIKDQNCELSSVMWRTAAAKLAFDPADGLEVIATGGIDVFERSGRYQLHVRKLEPKGVGALELAFRQLRDQLEKEGLFDPRRKKTLPRFPQRIAVVTSPTGAAIRDITQTLKRRWPSATVLLYPVSVQGPSAAGEIATAVKAIDANRTTLRHVDVMIIGRGGGSLEDLWAFNEEVVARAIHACTIPIVSAVGHEVDVSISDLVADVRAATPTAAAELVAPDRVDVSAQFDRITQRMTGAVRHRITLHRSAFDGLLQRRVFREPLTPIRTREQAIDELVTRLHRSTSSKLHEAGRRLNRCEVAVQRIRPETLTAVLERKLSDQRNRLDRSLERTMHRHERTLAVAAERFRALQPQNRVDRLRERVASLTARLEAMSHKNTLRRGFTITRIKKRKNVIRSLDQVKDGDIVITETTDGTFESRIVNKEQLELFD
jgi:exodeoxyribonuclease VII large subunit